MKNIARFNLYLCLAAAIAFTSGCSAFGHKKQDKDTTQQSAQAKCTVTLQD